MAIAGKHSQLFIGGSPISMATPLAMELESGKTYKLTSADSDKQIWRSPEIYPDYNYMDTKSYTFLMMEYEKFNDKIPYLFVFDGGTDPADRVDPANIEEVNYLTGRITFVNGYTVTGTVYVQTDYIPISTAVCGRSFGLSASVALEDSTTFYTNETDDFRRKVETLYESSVNVSNFFSETSNFYEKLLNSEHVYVKMYFDRRDTSKYYIVKGFVETDDINTDVEDIVTEDITIQSTEKIQAVR